MTLKNFIVNLRNTTDPDDQVKQNAKKNLFALFDENNTFYALFDDLRNSYRKQQQERKGMM